MKCCDQFTPKLLGHGMAWCCECGTFHDVDGDTYHPKSMVRLADARRVIAAVQLLISELRPEITDTAVYRRIKSGAIDAMPWARGMREVLDAIDNIFAAKPEGDDE